MENDGVAARGATLAAEMIMAISRHDGSARRLINDSSGEECGYAALHLAGLLLHAMTEMCGGDGDGALAALTASMDGNEADPITTALVRLNAASEI